MAKITQAKLKKGRIAKRIKLKAKEIFCFLVNKRKANNKTNTAEEYKFNVEKV